jgi:hypothetical protein
VTRITCFAINRRRHAASDRPLIALSALILLINLLPFALCRLSDILPLSVNESDGLVDRCVDVDETLEGVDMLRTATANVRPG